MERRRSTDARWAPARMPAWLRHRVGPRVGAPEDPAADRVLVARALAGLFLAGGALSLIWLALPHRSGADDTGVLIPSLAAVAWGLLLFAAFDRLPGWAMEATITMATVVITAALAADGSDGSVYVTYYFWATTYAYCFFPLRRAALQTAFVGVAFGFVLAAQREAWTSEIARWLITMGTLAAAGLLVHHLARALRHRSLHDPLTGLPNRRLFIERLDRALREARGRGERIAVLFLDLDRFKYVNDSLGHHAGDELLGAIAPRLLEAVRSGDLIARFGGDEFAVLSTGPIDERGALALGARLNAAIGAPLRIGDDDLVVSASIGVAVSGSGTEDGEALVRDADAAMYRAKDWGRARCELFDEDLRRWILQRLRTESDLRGAIGRDELRVAFQPIVALPGGRPVGLEALARWQHPRRGLVLPGEFIPVAEESGLIVPLGQWVLEEACRQAAEWDRDAAPLAGLPVSVNLSARQVSHPDLARVVRAALARAGLPPERLVLEITESVLIEQAAGPIATLAALRGEGVRFALDDFGTGYSSLSYLQRFPLDQLKLDRSFVAGLESGPREQAIVGAIVAMARALGIEAVAEGIETERQKAALERLGCPLGQGFLFARPASAAELAARAGAGGAELTATPAPAA
ncbi:MAG: EAL domain-containing protein [Solirubrobacteraceae bacterium]